MEVRRKARGQRGNGTRREGCEAQEAKIKSFIASQEGFKHFKTYSDQGFTGANIDRPQLKQMLSDINEGLVNAVLTYKIDRLTRSPKDFYQLIELFDAHNVSFISVTERFDTSTPSGRLLRNIMLTFAQFERELTSERLKACLTAGIRLMVIGGKIKHLLLIKKNRLFLNSFMILT